MSEELPKKIKNPNRVAGALGGRGGRGHGGARPGGGRPKGSPDKDWPSVRSILGKIGHNPVERLAKIAENRRAPVAVRARAEAELMRYCWPTLSSVAVSGPDGKPIQSEDVTRPEIVAARARLAVLLARRIAAEPEPAAIPAPMPAALHVAAAPVIDEASQEGGALPPLAAP